MNLIRFQRRSLLGRLMDFFSANPREELTLDDVVAKFNVARNVASARMYDAARCGLIERVTVFRLKPGALAKLGPLIESRKSSKESAS